MPCLESSFTQFFDAPFTFPHFCKTYVNGALEPYHWFHVSAFFFSADLINMEVLSHFFLLKMVAFTSTSKSQSS